MRPHMDTQEALRAVAEGRLVSREKYAALQRASLIRVRGHGKGSYPELTDAGRERLVPPSSRDEALMPRAKEHPLAGRRVVTHSGLALGIEVYVIDWIDRVPGLVAPGLRGTFAPDAVLVRDGLGRLLLPADELPIYDPVPVGYVS